MKAKFVLFLALFSGSHIAHAAGQLIPAGSLIVCTISDPKVNSHTEAAGDPILCRVNKVLPYQDEPVPLGLMLQGQFTDFKDPGHFVGKGWMELDFDRVYLHGNSVRMNARVVAAGKNKVDTDAHIQGRGHAVRDTISSLIPVLWPIDLINLPRRGPLPNLKAESKITTKVMSDFRLPDDPRPSGSAFSDDTEEGLRHRKTLSPEQHQALEEQRLDRERREAGAAAWEARKEDPYGNHTQQGTTSHE
ncbi:MAG: hypothetical protein ACRYFU_06180 [Janthinobacterium lividum]